MRFKVQYKEFDGNICVWNKPSFENVGMNLLTMGRGLGINVMLESVGEKGRWRNEIMVLC